MAKKFNEKISLENKIALDESLSKLVSERNSFAHGRDAHIGIDEIIDSYKNGQKVITILDETVHFSYDEADSKEKQTQINGAGIKKKKKEKKRDKKPTLPLSDL